MSNQLADAIAERDRILIALDIDAAKAFIAEHGGAVPAGKLDWVRVLHLARYEVETMPEELHWESRIFLARTGAQTVMTLPPKSVYARVALDLIFPKDLFEAHMRAKAAR